MSDETIELPVPDATAATPPSAPRPRLRVGAIVWGLIVTVIAATSLYVATNPPVRADVADWIGGLTPVSLGLIAILALGAIVLVASLVSVVKRAQLRRGGQPVG